ncbi:MAG: hypothetical protein KDK04_12590 [Candidatus Competibacteraceae bacterium]|nr:hypothetical protein [Candidatus Competibacteraceae bacterium]
MQQYFVPAFFIVLATLFLLMVYLVQRKQTRVDAIRSKYYSRHHMMHSMQHPNQRNSPQSGYQVLYERRAGTDRRVTQERRQNLRMGEGTERRQTPGRRKGDLLWVKDPAPKTH